MLIIGCDFHTRYQQIGRVARTPNGGDELGAHTAAYVWGFWSRCSQGLSADRTSYANKLYWGQSVRRNSSFCARAEHFSRRWHQIALRYEDDVIGRKAYRYILARQRQD